MSEHQNNKKTLETASYRRKPKQAWPTVKRLIRYMGYYKWSFLLVFVFAIIASVLQIIGPQVLGRGTTIITDGVRQGLKGNGYEIDFGALKHVAILFLLLSAFSALFRYLQQYTMSNAAQRVVFRLRQDMRDKLNRVPISFVDSTPHGEIMSRAVNDIENIGRTLQQMIVQIMMSVIEFVGVVAIMLSIDWQLSLVAFLVIPISLIMVGFIAPRSQRLFGDQQRAQGELNSLIEENFAGQIENKTFNQEDYKIDGFSQKSHEYYQAAWKAQFLSGILMPTMNLAKNFVYILVSLFGIFQVSQGRLTIGNTQAMLQYANMVSEPLKQTANMVNMLQSTIASAERVFEFLDIEEMEETKSDLSIEETDHLVSFDHVKFGYEPGKENLLMTDFNLDVNPGETVAIVGPTGAGKTTLINLLERFYEVSGGSIKINGKDIRDYSRQDVRNHFGMVLQDTWLFNGTIADNIRYGARPGQEVSDERVREVAEIANVDQFVSKLPEGYDTIANEDASNISQGQRQLITIARALMADPEILILDEATSSIDTRTETLIQQAMDELKGGRTSFVIAHRLSTIHDADKILVLNHGDVVEIGNQDELMVKQGAYYKLYNAQFTQ
ncbi:MAG: ABC transporter ATP-binding protein [Aerococcus sp.]|nr:ABC transporter ATP-binding protein [Aerococcus sp.]